MKKEGIVFAVLAIFLISFVSASVSYKGNSLKTSYFGGEVISGKINLSLSNEPANSKVTSNFNGSINLIDLIRANGLFQSSDFTCSTAGCTEDYKDIQEINDLKISQNEKKIIGFKITDSNLEVTDLNFSVTSDSPASCGQQIKITFPGSNMSIQNYRYKTTPCSEILRGCFSNSLDSSRYDSPAILSSSPLCEKINLPVAAAYYIGVNITNTTFGYSDIRMQIVSNESWEPLAQCNLPQMNKSNQVLGCVVNYSSLEQKDFYICVSAESPSEYKIRTERSGDICGTPSGSYNPQKDYDIFAQALPFSNVDIAVNKDTFSKFNNLDLIPEIYNYLNEKYQGNCTNGCFIPFEITGINQNINLAYVNLKYKSYNQPYVIDRIYSLESNYPKISMNARGLDISYANFTIPYTSSESRIKIYVGGEKILDSELNITSGFVFDINPKLVLPGVDTYFNISGTSGVISSNWDFGDNSSLQNSPSAGISHKYSKSGVYYVTVQANTASKTSRASFSIIVGNPKEATSLLILEGETRIGNITQKIGTYPSWVSQYLKDIMNLSDIQAQLNKVKSDYGVSTNDDQYTEQVTKLQNLKIPYLVSDSSSGTLPLAAISDKINPDYISSLSGNTKEIDEESFKKSISSWEGANYKSDVEFRKTKAYTDSGVISLATIVKIKLSPKGEIKDNAYLIIDYPVNAIKFSGPYGEKSIDSGTYISLDGKDQTIEFAVPGDMELSQLGIYISPDISRLSIGEEISAVEQPKFKTSWFIILITILLLITLTAYLILQEWYKRNYEASLFKNRDDLYNLINFIYNSRSSGLDEESIKKKLGKSGWATEQIKYALNKIDGKRTGMYEIPLFKFRENKEVKEEIEKRQKGGVDARFIKRPNP